MKKIFTFLFICIFHITNSQTTPDWLWYKGGQGAIGETANSITTDSNGYVYVTGNFTSHTLTIGTNTLINTGYYDIFIAKYSPAGTVVWAKSYGFTNDEESKGISVDNNGNIFITGFYKSSKLIFGTDTLKNNSSSQVFVAKLDSMGNAIWARSGGGNDWDYGYSVANDPAGNVYVTGYSRSTYIAFPPYSYFSSGQYDFFIVKYSPTGNVIWQKCQGGSEWDASTSISVDSNNDIVITGYYESPSIKFGADTIINTGFRSVFVAKYDSAGNNIWAKGPSGNGDDKGFGVCTDINNNVYIAGFMGSSTLTLDTVTLTRTGPEGVLLAKYSAAGNVLWARNTGGYQANGVACDNSGNAYFTGYYTGTVTCGTSTLTSVGSGDVLVGKYSSFGNPVWAKSAGGTSPDVATAICSGATGKVSIVGYFNSAGLSFNPGTWITNSGSSDFFVAQIDSSSLINETRTFLKDNTNAVYPNPFSNSTTFKSGKPLNDVTISIYNTCGQIIKQLKHLAGEKFDIQCNNLSGGIYFMNITDNDQLIYTTKLIILDN